MSRKISEVARFLNYFRTLTGDTRKLVADLVRETIREPKPQVSRRGLRPLGDREDSKIERAPSAKV